MKLFSIKRSSGHISPTHPTLVLWRRGKKGAPMKEIKDIIKRRNVRGFSFIEVLIGLIILAIGLLAIGGAQIISIKGGAFSKQITHAPVLVQNRLEELRRLPYNDAGLSGGEHNEGAIPEFIFSRRYHVEDKTSTLKIITVTVQWTDRVGHSISLSTILAKR